MRAYSEYKETGIEWLGKVPKKWNVTKLKFLGVSFGGLTYSPQDVVDSEHEGKLVLRSSNIQDGRLSLDDNVYVNTRIPEKLRLRKGDILICSRNGSQRLIGKNICIYDKMAGNTFGAFMMIFRSEAWQFLRHYFNSPVFTSQSALFLTATINQLTSNTLNNFWIAIPNSFEEQIQVAQYLDHKTAQIEKLITDKEKLIELLNEERTAIVNQAMSNGLNSEAPMKDSGIDWLGEMPEHWEVKKLKYILKWPLKYGANEPADDDNPENPRYIRITDFSSDGTIKKDTFKSLPLSKANDFLLEEGDILFARSGATVGKTFHFKNYQGKACFAGYLIKATVNSQLMNSDFLYYFTRTSGYNGWKESIFQQATIQNIGADKYNQLVLGVPELLEQKSIIEYIDSGWRRIDNLTDKIKQEIQLLKEYKTALISEVVTGKVDVRDEVIAKTTELVS